MGRIGEEATPLTLLLNGHQEMTLPPIYPLTPDDRGTEALLEWAKALLGAGCALFQHRRKTLPDAGRLAELEALLKLAQPFGATVLVNDRPDLCLLAGAGGLHLGQEDLPPESVRAFLGRKAFIGFSTHSIAQARDAFDLPLDYLALGPVFPTASKEKASPVVPVEEQQTVLAESPFPVVAIGGITPGRATELWRRGFASVAVIGALAEEPEKGWKAFEEARVRR